jgi:uncharacterized Zn finger protein (UPF0148 family)
MSGPEDGARIKSAASLLLKGGTLVGEPCLECGGVQVRLGDKTTCIGCGREIMLLQPEAPKQQAPSLQSAAAIIEEKIAAVASELKEEQDTAAQKDKSELLESYLRILEKLRSLSSGTT